MACGEIGCQAAFAVCKILDDLIFAEAAFDLTAFFGIVGTWMVVKGIQNQIHIFRINNIKAGLSVKHVYLEIMRDCF